MTYNTIQVVQQHYNIPKLKDKDWDALCGEARCNAECDNCIIERLKDETHRSDSNDKG